MDAKGFADKLLGQGIDPRTCGHANPVMVKAKDSAGRAYYIKQCQTCYRKLGSNIGKEHATGREPAMIEVDWDYFYQGRSRIKQAMWQEQHEEWLDEHNAYLQSPEWKAKRLLVLKRCNGICEGCLQRKATIVHHLTYAHWRNELLFELVGVCDCCHAVAHPNKELQHAR